MKATARSSSPAARHLIFRTSWIYDETGKNFLNTMLKLGAERETLRVVADQHGAPTYAAHLAAASWAALSRALIEGPARFPSGIYHLCNEGETTWHGFARAIFDQALALGVPLKAEAGRSDPHRRVSHAARRPNNSRLDTGLSRARSACACPTGTSACATAWPRKFAR